MPFSSSSARSNLNCLLMVLDSYLLLFTCLFFKVEVKIPQAFCRPYRYCRTLDINIHTIALELPLLYVAHSLHCPIEHLVIIQKAPDVTRCNPTMRLYIEWVFIRVGQSLTSKENGYPRWTEKQDEGHTLLLFSVPIESSFDVEEVTR